MRSLQGFAADKARIVYVDTQDKFESQYLAESGIGKSVLLVQLSPGAAVNYEARAVPQLVLVGLDGRVQWSHIGELAPSDVSKIRSLIERR